jgi:hypothetical protein
MYLISCFNAQSLPLYRTEYKNFREMLERLITLQSHTGIYKNVVKNLPVLMAVYVTEDVTVEINEMKAFVVRYNVE